MGAYDVRTFLLPWCLGAALIATAGCGGGATAVPATPRTLSATPGATTSPNTVVPSTVVVADHVRNLAYYGLNGVNAGVPASYMAAHVDMVEDDGFTAQHALAYKQAGGKLAFAYTDPAFVPHCVAPFTAPAGPCAGPIGSLVSSNESAWIHDKSGNRINRFYSSGNYQESLNLASSAARQAYAANNAAILAASPLLDGFFAADSGNNFTAAWCAQLGCGFWYGFNANGVEIASDSAYISAESGMLAAAGKPVIIDGSDNDTLAPAYTGAFVKLPRVIGEASEGCFNDAGSLMAADGDGRWTRVENALIAMASYHKFALCYPAGDTSPAHRLYAYASWLLTYDPAYSVYASTVPQSDGNAIFPETQLVPAAPLASASAIAQLQKGSLYVREFSVCAIGAVRIGSCAALVNPSSSATATIPALTQSYTSGVVLDAASLYSGGKARVVSGLPATLAPKTAAILVGPATGSVVITTQSVH